MNWLRRFNRRDRNDVDGGVRRMGDGAAAGGGGSESSPPPGATSFRRRAYIPTLSAGRFGAGSGAKSGNRAVLVPHPFGVARVQRCRNSR